MRIVYWLFASFILLIGPTAAEVPSLAFMPLVNELSLYQNYSDDGDDLGQTLQIVSINSFRVLTDFNFEFTADFNRDMTPGKSSDYYMELSIVKPVWQKVSFNYQRIYGTFSESPVNQVGFRYSF